MSMEIPFPRMISLLVLGGAFFLPTLRSSFQDNTVASKKGSPILVLIEGKHGQVTYKVESKSVRTQDMLNIFRGLAAERGADRPVWVLIEETCPFNKLWFIEGVAGKIGFRDFREFVFRSDRYYMYEITFGEQVPFSTSPSQEK